MELSATRAGVPPHQGYTVRNLWRHRSWASSAKNISATVAPDDVVMLRVRAAPKRASTLN
jgi:hypothetical protein